MLRRVCIFAHYDAAGEIKPYVRIHLSALKKLCDRIIFVTSSERTANMRSSLHDLIDDFLTVPNKGYDFGMWQHAINKVKLRNIRELVLTNSSILGPVAPLEACFEQMAELPIDIWSMTDNHELLWHMQSYFLVFRERALVSGGFEKFWKQLIPYRDKWQTILSYELGLSTYFREEGLSLRALFPTHMILPQNNGKNNITLKPKNPVMAWPEELIQTGFPYVKIELLRENPYRLDLAPVHQRLSNSGFESHAIELGRKQHHMRNINH